MTIDIEKYRALVMRPGKFQGESPATPYFYECWLDGDGENVYGGQITGDEADDWALFTFFEVDSDEAVVFGFAARSVQVLWEDENGFVHSENYKDRNTAEEGLTNGLFLH